MKLTLPAKIIVFLVFILVVFVANHYINTITLPDKQQDSAMKQMEVDEGNTASKEMRQYQVIQGIVEPVTWIIILVGGLVIFGSNIKRVWKKNSEAVSAESKC